METRKPGVIVDSFRTSSGQVVNIRTLDVPDAEAALTYINTLIAEDTYILLSGNPLTIAEERAFVESSVAAMDKGDKAVFVVEVDGVFSGILNIDRQPLRRSHAGVIGISLSAPFGASFRSFTS